MRKSITILSVLVILAMVLVACAPSPAGVNQNTPANAGEGSDLGLPQTGGNSSGVGVDNSSTGQSGASTTPGVGDQSGQTGQGGASVTQSAGDQSGQTGQAGPSTTQVAGDQGGASATPGASGQSGQGQSGQGQPVTGSNAGNLQENLVSLSDMLNTSVVGMDQQQLGAVQDAIINLASGRVQYLFVQDPNAQSSGEWMGLPWSATRLTDIGGQRQLSTSVGAEAWAKAPRMTNEQLSALGDADWDTEISNYWKQQGGIDLNATANAINTQLNGFLRASELQTIRIQGLNGAIELGQIRDVVVDPQTGQVQYILLVPSADLGLGERVIPVPLGALQMGQNDMAFNLPFDISMLQNAPALDQATINGMTAQEWSDLISTWWEDQGVTAAPGNSGQNNNNQSGGSNNQGGSGASATAQPTTAP